jgi:hypothetical protein
MAGAFAEVDGEVDRFAQVVRAPSSSDSFDA